MKNLFVLLMFFAPPLFSQATDSTACPEGQKWYWGRGTSGCEMSSGCYTPEEAKKESRFISRCICLETQMWGLGFASDLGEAENHKWNDSLGCISSHEWWQWHGPDIDKRTMLTELQYDSILISRGIFSKGDYLIGWRDSVTGESRSREGIEWCKGKNPGKEKWEREHQTLKH